MPEQTFSSSSQDNNLQNQTNIPVQSHEGMPQHTTNKIFHKVFIVCIIILIFMLIAIGTFLVLSKKTKPQESVKATINPMASSFALNLEEELKAPALYPEFDWKEVGNHEEKSQFSVDFDLVEIPTLGKQWHYTSGIVNSLDELYALRSGINNHYEQEFSKLGGWSNTVGYNGKSIQAIVADGTGGGIIGYIKIVDSKMRLVIIQNQTDEPIRLAYGCPCKISFDIFVSDIFSTTELER